MNIIFMGTPHFSLPTLNKLLENKYNVMKVFTRLDKPQGRGLKIKTTPVGDYCQNLSLPVFKTGSLKKNEIIEEIKNLNPEAIVVVAFGAFLPKEILQIPKYGCINLHPSLLPKYRGPSPIHYALLEGDKTTGVTTMILDEGTDTGPILLQEEVSILPDDTYGILSRRLAIIGADLMIKTLKELKEGKIIPKPQDNSKATITKKIEKEDCKIDWKLPAEKILNMIRAFNPFPGAYTYFNKKILKIWEAELVPFESDKFLPGMVIDVKSRGIDIACGKDAIRIKKLQLEGKNACYSYQFTCGYKILTGELWG